MYLAADVKHRRRVAVKVLRPDLAASIGTDRFLKEIEIAAGLAHPHIVPLHDSGEADPRHAIRIHRAGAGQSPRHARSRAAKFDT